MALVETPTVPIPSIPSANVALMAHEIPTDSVPTKLISVGQIVGLLSVANIAALKDAQTRDGLIISVGGYYTDGDGGGGIFRYVAAAVTAGNNGTIITPNSGVGRWYRVCDARRIEARWFGAKGNGTWDDTTHLNAAVTYLSTVGGGRLIIDAGVYITVGLSVRADNIIIEGAGSAYTTLRRKAGSTIPLGGVGGVLELGDTYNGNSSAEYAFIRVFGLTLDGNKDNVVQADSDLTDWGLPLTKVSYSHFQDVRSINCWNGGVGVFINSNYNSCRAVHVKNCGAGNTSTGGEPGFDINSSKYNQFSFTSESCRYGARILDNCWTNIIDAVILDAGLTGYVFDNQAVNTEGSRGNIIRATIQGGCADQGVSFGTWWRNNTHFLNIQGITGVGVRDVATASQPCQGNKFFVTSRLCGRQSCWIQNRGNTWYVDSVDDGGGAGVGDYFAIDVDGATATENQITANITDTRGTPKVRGIVFRGPAGAGANNNRIVSYTFKGVVESYNDIDGRNFWNDKPTTYVGVTAEAIGNGFTNTFGGASDSVVGYHKTINGIVHLRGQVAGAGTGTIFTLPVGCRPSSDLYFATHASDDGSAIVIKVLTTGVVRLHVATSFTPYLAGISFPIAP